MQHLHELVETVLEKHFRPSEWSKLGDTWRSRRLFPTLSERIEQSDYRKSQGAWVPACGGTNE